jgi:hypothetical protein
LGGTIDELFEADVMGEIFRSVVCARKVGDGSGVLVQRLTGLERAQAIAQLRDGSPMCALEGADRRARTAGKLAKIFGPHTAS